MSSPESKKKYIIHRFHAMETKYDLFNIGEEINLPIWDIIRYEVFRNISYPAKDRNRLFDLKKKSKNDYAILLKSIFKYIFIFPFKKATIIFFTSSRYLYNNKYIDKASFNLIGISKSKNLIIESLLNSNLYYDSFLDFSNIVNRFHKNKNTYKSYFDQINSILAKCFNENIITYEQFHSILKLYKSQYNFYYFIMKTKRPKKIIISTGNPKALLAAAKKFNVDTNLVQHASIEIDEIDYSYPSKFNSSNYLFANSVYTFGEYWCKNVNVPAKNILVSGNDFFSLSESLYNDDSILFISSIVHGNELANLLVKFYKLYPNFKFVFKLHPNEFHYKDEYLSLFKGLDNIHVITDEIDTTQLVLQCTTVVLIASAVLYQALQIGKRVAIFKRINYERQELISAKENLNFFDNENELFDILMKIHKYKKYNYFEPFRKEYMTTLLNS